MATITPGDSDSRDGDGGEMMYNNAANKEICMAVGAVCIEFGFVVVSNRATVMEVSLHREWRSRPFQVRRSPLASTLIWVYND